MNRDMKIFLAAAAVFCSYLILSLPFSSALQINLIFNQAVQDSVIVNPQGLVSKELSIEHDTLWSKINAHLEIRVAQPQYEIKRAYVYFCGGLDPIDCITKDPVTFESYVNVSKNWNDIFSGQQYRYPQTSNVLSIVRVDIGGKITWTGFWDQIERVATQEFKIRSFDTSSADVYLKSLEDLALARDFIQDYSMVPALWVGGTSFGMIEQTDTQVLYGIGADQTEMPRFRPWKTIGKTVGEIGKEYELVFPGTSSLTANPVTINSNPPYVCGNSVCETDAGESQANCCLDCTDPKTRECTGDLEGYTCYTDAENPYGYCGSRCGENGCERGEDSGNCCLDCDCQGGFLCDVSPWNLAGSCINSSAINLILDSAKTTGFKSCEIPHDAELSVHVMNAPSDLRVQQWYYTLNTNETGTQISSQRVEVVEGPNVSAPHMYNLKIHLDPLPECRQGRYDIEHNTLYALVTYGGGNLFRELSTGFPAITIIQETISMKQIQENLKERMMAVMDFIEDGMELTKMMLMICIITIIAMLLIAVLGGISFAFGGEKIFGPGGTVKQAGTPAPGDLEGGRLSLSGGTHYFRGPLGQALSVTPSEGVTKETAAQDLVKAKYGIPDYSLEGKFFLSREAADQFKPAEIAEPASEKTGNHYYNDLSHMHADKNTDGILTWDEAETHSDATGLSVTVGDFRAAGKATAPDIITSEPGLFGKWGKVITDGKGNHYYRGSKDWYIVNEDGSKKLVPEVIAEGGVLAEAGSWDAVVEHAGTGKFQVTKPTWGNRAWSGIKSIPGKVIGGIGKFATGFMRFFQQFHEGLKVGFYIAQTVCNVASMLIQIFTSMTQVWTKYIAFQTCMEMYENQIGKGICDQSPESCVNQLLGCLNSLDGIKQDAQNMIPEIGTASYTGGRGTPSAQMTMYEVGKTGSLSSTCGQNMIYFTLYYGFYSTMTMKLIPPQGTTYEDCYERQYSEGEMKSIIPINEKNAMPADQLFKCGEGRYYFTIYGDSTNIGTFGISYKESCEEDKGKIDKDTQREAGALIEDARSMVDTVKDRLDPKEKDVNIGHLENAITKMNDAKKAMDKDRDDVIENIDSARAQIVKAKAGLDQSQQDALGDAITKLDRAKEALE